MTDDCCLGITRSSQKPTHANCPCRKRGKQSVSWGEAESWARQLLLGPGTGIQRGRVRSMVARGRGGTVRDRGHWLQRPVALSDASWLCPSPLPPWCLLYTIVGRDWVVSQLLSCCPCRGDSHVSYRGSIFPVEEKKSTFYNCGLGEVIHLMYQEGLNKHWI